MAPLPPASALSTRPNDSRPATSCDVAIIGAGPAGATAAMVLADAGMKVQVLERSAFPRFHVGESLLPFQKDLLERLGLVDVIAGSKFLPKHGARFSSCDGSVENRFSFKQYLKPPYDGAWEVERAQFDQLLVDQARARGAVVREECAVVDAHLSPGDCTLQLRATGSESKNGDAPTTSALQAKWVFDASGQNSFLSRRMGLRKVAGDLEKVALFTHYRGAFRQSGESEGDIQLIFGDGCWFWYIPLRDGVTSVGCVTDSARWKSAGQSAPDFFEERVQATPLVVERLESATTTRPVQVAADFSYRAESIAGPGWTLIGDAAAFLDPIFSTGVLLAMQSGERAALDLIPGLRNEKPLSPRLFKGYGRAHRHWTKHYFKLIRAFYHPGFAPVFFSPGESYKRAMAPFLAGSTDLTLRQRIKLGLFYRLVRMNHRFGFIPDPRPEAARAHHG